MYLISQSIFPKWQFPERAISEAATSQVYPSRSARHPACFSRKAHPPYPIQAPA